MPEQNLDEIRRKLAAVTDTINKLQGDGTVFTVADGTLNIPRWSTGIADLDAILGGGMPVGRVIEIFGAESAGKTTLCHHLTSRHPFAVAIPIEGTWMNDRAMIMGNTAENLLVCRAKYGEDAMNAISMYIRTGVPIICLDSIPSCVPKEDIEKMAKAAARGQEFDPRMAGVPRLMSKYLHDISVQCEIFGTTLIFVNQVREKFNSLAFGDKLDTPGGKLLRHTYSVRLQVARRAWIEVPNKNPAITSTQEKVGMIMKVKCVKSKIHNPMGEVEIPLFFDRGFVSWDQVEPIRKELMKARREQFKGVNSASECS